MAEADFNIFKNFFDQHEKFFVLTGAGVSAASGIPTYRDHKGNWKRSDPIKHNEFIDQINMRKRYWARSMVGWKYVKKAEPSPAHRKLADLEAGNRIEMLVTQNVDGLHQRAGSKKTIDLHGRLDQVICMDCRALSKRADLQVQLEALNPPLAEFVATQLPDGDADIDDFDMTTVNIPDCQDCGGMLKPDVVFFGDNVPRARVKTAMDSLQNSDALLVVGSSLQVFSGYRFCKIAKQNGTPIGCINIGLTRADSLLSAKLIMDCSHALSLL